MDSNSLIIKLNNLIHVDIAAYHAYRKCIETIKNDVIKEKLLSFQKDHERHIEKLRAIVKQLNGEPLFFNRDLKSFLVEAFNRDFKSFLTSSYIPFGKITHEVDGALKAMETNESITKEKYERMLEEDLPDEIKETIVSNRNDVKNHLVYIKEAICKIYESSSFVERRLLQGLSLK